MQAEPVELAGLATELRDNVPHKVVKPPAQELVMFQAEESVEKLDFNVGEILVTTAHVRVAGITGFGMIMDLHPDKALDCALLMGVYEARLPEAGKVEELARLLKTKQDRQLREEREIVSSTRVNFEVMGGQDSNVKHNADTKKDSCHATPSGSEKPL